MDNNTLKQYFYLQKEVKQLKDHLLNLRAVSTTVGTPSIDHVNSGGYNSPTEKIAIEIMDVEMLLQDRLEESVLMLKEIFNYINSIDDALLRLIIIKRYVECKSWNVVAIEIGGGNTPEGLRKRVHRHLQS